MSFDVVDSTCKYLESRLPGAPCFPEKPSAAPADFVTVERTGGQRGAFSDSPNLAVQAWSDEDWRAYGLALEAADALSRMWEMVDEVCRAEVGSGFIPIVSDALHCISVEKRVFVSVDDGVVPVSHQNRFGVHVYLYAARR